MSDRNKEVDDLKKLLERGRFEKIAVISQCLMTFFIFEANAANPDFFKTPNGAALQQTFNEFQSFNPNGLLKFLQCRFMNEATKKFQKRVDEWEKK